MEFRQLVVAISTCNKKVSDYIYCISYQESFSMNDKIDMLLMSWVMVLFSVILFCFVACAFLLFLASLSASACMHGLLLLYMRLWLFFINECTCSWYSVVFSESLPLILCFGKVTRLWETYFSWYFSHRMNFFKVSKTKPFLKKIYFTKTCLWLPHACD